MTEHQTLTDISRSQQRMITPKTALPTSLVTYQFDFIYFIYVQKFLLRINRGLDVNALLKNRVTF